MDKTQIAAVVLSVAACIGSAVNLARRSDANSRLEALSAQSGPGSKAGAQGSDGSAAGSTQAALEELKRLRTEVASLKEDVAKVKAGGTSGGTNGTGTNGGNPDGARPLRPEDVVRIMEEEEHRRWKESRLAEIKTSLKILEGRKTEYAKKMKKDLFLSDQQAGQAEAFLNDQLAAFTVVLNELEIKPDRQDRLNAIAKDFEEKMKTILDANQQRGFESLGPNWHQLSQKIDSNDPNRKGKR